MDNPIPTPPNPGDGFEGAGEKALREALDRVTRLHPKVIDLSLDRILRLLEALGSPHKRVPPVIHVAGTNGKGSVVATLRAVLEASGYKVHVYTSPHLVSFTERVRICGNLVDETLFAAMLDHVEGVNGDAPITFFEIITAAAFQIFAQIPADVLLLETGLGGRLDATNVVDKPWATVLTPIAMDHMSYLGETLSAIAGEKAAIMKSDVPCISSVQKPEAVSVIEEAAHRIGAPLLMEGRDWTAVADDLGSVNFECGETAWSVPGPRLAGPHQIQNLGVALAVLANLPVPIPPFGLRAGIRKVEWPARCQKLVSGPAADRLPAAWDLWLDGGHNPSAGEALAGWLAADPMPTGLVCGMMNTKDSTGFLAPLAGQAQAAVTVPIPAHDGCVSPEDLAEKAKAAGIAEVRAAGDVVAAVESLKEVLGPGRARILICGSLYLAGEVLKTHA